MAAPAEAGAVRTPFNRTTKALKPVRTLTAGRTHSSFQSHH